MFPLYSLFKVITDVSQTSRDISIVAEYDMFPAALNIEDSYSESPLILLDIFPNSYLISNFLPSVKRRNLVLIRVCVICSEFSNSLFTDC